MDKLTIYKTHYSHLDAQAERDVLERIAEIADRLRETYEKETAGLFRILEGIEARKRMYVVPSPGIEPGTPRF